MPLLDALRLADADLETAAGILAKTAQHVRRHGPIVKEAAGIMDTLRNSPAMPHNWDLSTLTKPVRDGYAAMSPDSKSILQNAAIGAGIGGVGSAAVNAMQGRKKRHLLNAALAGALGGAGVGAAGTALAQRATSPAPPIETNDEAYRIFQGKPWLDRAVTTFAGDAPEAPAGKEPITPAGLVREAPGAAVGMAADGAAGVASGHPLKTLGVLGGTGLWSAHAHAKDVVNRLNAGIEAMPGGAGKNFVQDYATNLGGDSMFSRLRTIARDRRTNLDLNRAMELGDEALRAGGKYKSHLGGVKGVAGRAGLLALLAALAASKGY